MSNESTVCSSRGSCIGPNYCSCSNTQEYTGFSCELPVCNSRPSTDPLACGMHGHCVSPNQCQCDSAWYGSNCEHERGGASSDAGTVIVSVVAGIGGLVLIVIVIAGVIAVVVIVIRKRTITYVNLGDSAAVNTPKVVAVPQKAPSDENPFGSVQPASGQSGYNEL